MSKADTKQFLSVKLPNTDYTVQEIIDILTVNCLEFSDLVNANEVKQCSSNDISDCKGYMSNVLKTVFTFKNDEKFSCMIKVPAKTLLEDVEKHNLLNPAFKSECNFYNTVKNIDLPIPKCYYANDGSNGRTPILILENLSDTSTSVPFNHNVSKETALDYAKMLGSFQAKLLHLPKDTFVSEIAEKHINIFIELHKKYEEKFVELDSQFDKLNEATKFIYTHKFLHYAYVGIAKEKHLHSFVHGDAHTNNLLFKLNSDGSTSKKIAALIDFQTAYDGNPLVDLVMFMAFCVDGSIRRTIDREYVDMYYDTMVSELQNLERDVPFTRVEAHLFYDYAFIAISCRGLFTAAIIADPKTKFFSLPEDIIKATVDHYALRIRHCLEDAVKLIDKHNIGKKFLDQ